MPGPLSDNEVCESVLDVSEAQGEIQVENSDEH